MKIIESSTQHVFQSQIDHPLEEDKIKQSY